MKERVETPTATASAAGLPRPLAGSLSWQRLIEREWATPNGQALLHRLREAEAGGAVIYPPKDEWFRAFDRTSFEGVRAVIVGQDPYHEAGQAHGIAFSVKKSAPIPPSLKNIFKELRLTVDNFGFPASGSLEGWAQQGVLLINRILTVEAGKAGSHRGWGWELFVLHLLQALVSRQTGLVFLLWGREAASLQRELDLSRQSVLVTSHPSPLSANRGFLGSRCFVLANERLQQAGKAPIDWCRTEALPL